MLGLLYHHAARLDASNRDVTESHGWQIFCSVMHFHSYIVDMRNIKITAQMLSQIAEIEAFKGTWNASTHMRMDTVFDNYSLIPLSENYMNE